MIENLTRAMLAEQINTKFHVRPEEIAPLDMELIEVTGPQTFSGHEQFSIILRGALTPQLPQRIYKIEHGAIGEFELFLVPIGKDQNGVSYQAVFNRKVNS